MTSKHYFNKILKLEIKDSFIYTVTTIVTQLGNFLIIPLFWKVFTPADYGVIAITEIIGTFLSVILGLSLDLSISRFYYEWPEDEKKKRIGAIWMMSWGSSLVLGFTAVCLLYFITPLLFSEVSFFPIIYLGLINTILVSLTTVVLTTIRIKKLSKLFCGFRLTSFFLQIGLSLYYVLVLKNGLPGYFTALVISSAIMAILSMFVMRLFAQPCIKNAGIKEAIKYSIPIIPSSIISASTSILDRFLLKQFCSMETLGIYSIATKFASIILVVQSTLKLSYQPFFMKNINSEGGKKAIYQMAGVYIFPIFLCGLLVSIFIDKIVYLINQPEYFKIINFVPYLVIINIISSLNIFYGNGIAMSNRTYLTIYPAIIQFVTLLSGVFLIPAYQTDGVIIAKFISVSFYLMVLVIISNSVYKLRYNWSNLCKFSGLMIAGILINKYMHFSLPLNYIISFTVTILFIVCSIMIIKNQINTN